MKKLLLFLLISFTGILNNSAQEKHNHEAPNLQIGLGGLNLMKGTLDSEAISSMIIEKEQEIKVQLIRNMMLNRVGDAGGLLYGYVDNVFNVLLTNHSPRVITNAVIENTVNVTFVYAFADYYLSVLDSVQKKNFNKLAMACGYALPNDYTSKPFPSTLRQLKSTYSKMEKQEGKTSRADEAESLTSLVALYLDIAAEAVRNNETLFRLGLMRSGTSGIYSSMNTYINLPKPSKELSDFTFLRKYTISQETLKEIDVLALEIKNKKEAILKQELKKESSNSNTIKQSREDIKIKEKELEAKRKSLKNESSQLAIFKYKYAKEIYTDMQNTIEILTNNSGLLNYLMDFNGWQSAAEKDGKKLAELVKSLSLPSGRGKSIDDLVQSLKVGAENLVNTGVIKKEDNANISRLLSFAMEIERGLLTSGKFQDKSEILYHLNNVIIPGLQSLTYLSSDVIRLIEDLENVGGKIAMKMLDADITSVFPSKLTPFISMISNLYEFDEDKTYSTYVNLLPEIGSVFSNDRIENALGIITGFLKNYTIFFTDDDGNKGIQVDAEGILANLSEMTYNKSRPLEFYFVVGANTASFKNDVAVKDDAIKAYSFLGEKIGIKYKIWDWAFTNSFHKGETYKYYGRTCKRNSPGSKPVISNIHAMLYGSGIMYSLINTSTEKDFNKPLVGAGLGITFFNDLDFNLSYGIPVLGSDSFSDNFDHTFFNVGIDVRFVEYLKKINSGKK